MSKTRQAHILLLIVGLIYGINYSVGKWVTPQYLPPLGLVAIRVTVCWLLFWGYHALFVREKVMHRRDYLRLFLAAIFGVTCNQLLFFKGLSLTSPINASVIMTMNPIIVLVLSAVFLKEVVTWKKIIGMVLGFVGAFLLLARGGFSMNSDTFVGDLCVLLNAASYGTYLILVKPLTARYKPETVVRWIFTFGLPLVLIIGGPELSEVTWSEVPTKAWLSMGYIILGTTFFAYLLNAKALQHVSSSIVGYYIYLQPFIATLVAISLGQDAPTFETVLSAGFIFAGVFLVSQPQLKQKLKA